VGSGTAQKSKIGTAKLETTVGSRAYPTRTLLGPTPTPVPSAAPTNPPVTQTINGDAFQNCQPSPSQYYCLTNDPSHPNAVYTLSGGNGNQNFSASYKFNAIPAGTYQIELSYYNFQLGGLNPPANYSYHVTIGYPGGSEFAQLPIESTNASRNLHTYTSGWISVSPSPSISVTWDNDSNPAGFDANFALNSIKLIKVGQ
jgi:hypothetical protein